MTNFSELSISAQLKSNLVKNGFTTPTPVQALAIEPALSGRDVVATAQTGTGKTLAFVLPLIERLAHHKWAGALVWSPTRQLPIQINDALAKMAGGSALKSAVSVGALSESVQLKA